MKIGSVAEYEILLEDNGDFSIFDTYSEVEIKLCIVELKEIVRIIENYEKTSRN